MCRLGSFVGMKLLFIEMVLGFYVTLEVHRWYHDGPRVGNPREETRMTRGVSLLALLGAWNDPCTIATQPLSQLCGDTYLLLEMVLRKLTVMSFP